MNENSVTHLFYILSEQHERRQPHACVESAGAGPSAPASQQSVLQRGTQTPLKHMSPWKHLKIRCFPSPALRPAGTCKAHRITSEGNRGGREERGRKNSSSMRKFYCTPPPLLSLSVHHPPRPPPAGQSVREPDWDETSAPLRETPHLSEQVGCCCRNKLLGLHLRARFINI